MQIHSQIVGSYLHIGKTNIGNYSPIGIQTPTIAGELYFDISSEIFWVAKDITNNSWVKVGGASKAFSFFIS